MMPCDYDAIRRDNRRRYGTEIGRFGKTLLANRYGDRTQFIYELLQNAEDALARRKNSTASRAVSFELDAAGLRVSHFGAPFDEKDIRGICGIGESTKDLTDIGRFGIGFKSVYAFSDRPEIHSGSEAFAIENFVWPTATEPVARDRDETVILIPFREDHDGAKTEIAAGLARLGLTSLLFLRQIAEIRWSVDGTFLGFYLREAVQEGPGIRRVSVIGQKPGEPEVDEQWLVFSRPVYAEDTQPSGHVEIAWLTRKDRSGRERINVVEASKLVAFFPTVVETGLGFLMQGPYRTTLSRDNVPQRDHWNRTCVRETGKLLIESLRWLRDEGLLDTTALSCLPLDSPRFALSMFSELFEETKRSLRREKLLPAFGGTHVSARDCCLARTEDLRQLLSSKQLAALHGSTRPLHWLARTISRDRTPELRRYLVGELNVREFTPEALLYRLNTAFVDNQTDEWVQGLYEFLGTQPALRERTATLPILRLEDGTHVPPTIADEPQAFLPGPMATDFPTVRAAVCQTARARRFLESLNLTEPDPVHHVIRNILPKYQERKGEIPDQEYSSDIALMLSAADTDSRTQREKLVKALRETPWVRAVDAGDKRRSWARPADLYLATNRLQTLFDGIAGVLLVDARFACLRGEQIRALLQRSGALRHLQPIGVKCDLTQEQLTAIRRSEGLERASWSNIQDKTIRGLPALLEALPNMEPPERRNRSRKLWVALGDLIERRGPRSFEAKYEWGYYREYRVASFDSCIVRMLKEHPWVPDGPEALRPPGSVVFEDVGWEPNSYLQSKIPFKAPLVEQLAEEAGFEPAALIMLQQLGITTEADLREFLQVDNESQDESSTDGDDGVRPTDHDSPRGRHPTGSTAAAYDGSASVRSVNEVSTPDRPTRHEFVSYVRVAYERSDAEKVDLDKSGHAARIKLEEKAIGFIQAREPAWRLAPPNNPGFDLYQGSTMRTATHWCEVKAMSGSLSDRPVGMSRVQFECARGRGNRYWLYIVERAGDRDANIVRIQDPAGKAKTFTFDHGWRAVAEAEAP